jgi:hypothetical protein
MTKERDKKLLETFYKESGIHHAISQNTYRNFVERFLATRPDGQHSTGVYVIKGFTEHEKKQWSPA